MEKVTKTPAAKTKKPVKAAVKKTVAKKTVVKKTIVKKYIVAKKVVKKAPVKKGAVKKAPPKKIAAQKPVVKKTAVPQGPRGIPELMRDEALKILNERKAEDIVSVSLAGKSSVADYLIIASGRAGRQVSAIADYLRDGFYKLGAKQVRIEGLGEANWVLVDGGDVIVHLFRPEVRAYYDLDAIWNAPHTTQSKRPRG